MTKKETLAEDPFVLDKIRNNGDWDEQPWSRRSPEEMQAWARQNLHQKLTASSVIKVEDYPEWEWFRKSGFGIFLHWGLASVPPNNGDAWAMVWHKDKSPDMLSLPEDMFRVAESWNPEKYDPDKWLAAAKKAGFGYAVLTTRHHDGYCLWPSKYGGWDTGKYMNGRDLVKDYVKACRKHDLRVGFYYSGPNWHYAYKHKDFSWPPQGVNYQHEHVDVNPPLAALMSDEPALPGNLAQLEHEESAAQVRELMTSYGPVDMMWWDGSCIMTEQELAAMQSDVFVARGYIATPEGKHQGADENVKVTNEAGWWWELCIKTENKDTPYWHYNPELEENHWDTNKFLSELIRCRSLGGNLLVNITPKGDGEMMDWYYKVCNEMADWMAHSREAVYDVDLNAPLPTLDKTRNYTTVKGDVWYAMPDDKGTVFVSDISKPKSVGLLRTGEMLDFEYRDDALRVMIPSDKRTQLPDMVKISF